MKLGGALAWIGLLALSGCTRTEVEYDRMVGTTFPPKPTVDGKQVTISSIYATERYTVDVIEDETNIPALTGPANPRDPNQYDYITESELDTLERAHRSSPVGKTRWICSSFGFFPTFCTSYHLYGIVVNHFTEENDGTRDTSIMGRMWTTKNRRAFANFYRHPTVSGDGGKYLRSAAHEIGHAFNLHHEDGDGSTDIMNQTSVVGNNYVYRFVAAASKNHLQDHPDECKYPGQSAFHAAHANHANHGVTAPPCPSLFLPFVPLPGKNP